MSISLPAIPLGNTNWAGTVNGYWQTIQEMLNSLVGQNILINGGFDFAQRQAPATPTAIANNTYGPDRWYLLSGGTAPAVQYSRVTGDTTSQYAGEINVPNNSTTKWSIVQIIESNNTIPLRNSAVRFQVRVKSSGTPNIRLAILEWTGTADTLSTARDLVNNWANSADSNPATTFLKSTTMNVLANTAATATSGSYTDFSVTATLGSSSNNLIVFVWTPSAVTQSVTVDFTQAGLYSQTEGPRVWLPRPIQQELAMCQRYAFTLVGANGETLGGALIITSGTTGFITIKHPVTMRASPVNSFVGTLGHLQAENGAGNSFPVTNFADNTGNRSINQSLPTVTAGAAAGWAANQAGVAFWNGSATSSDYMLFDAEL